MEDLVDEVDDAALDIIGRLDSYTEVSPSGTGYHVLVTGKLPDGRNRRGSVELYDTARFFTVTGDHVKRTPTRVARRQDALTAIHREYVQDTDTESASDPEQHGGADEESPTTGAADVDVDPDDEDLIEKARNASNGEKFERLWNGNTVGYDSQSEADMALCCLLAFWTGGDQTQMEHLFRQSGLLREKWDEVHYADGSTYGRRPSSERLRSLRSSTIRAPATIPQTTPPADRLQTSALLTRSEVARISPRRTGS